jgi:choline dehydrogenase-like flavoprotein
MSRLLSVLHLLGVFTPLLYQIPMAEASSVSFDYVVIGGGTAGLVVASRLAEDEGKTVVVLEAGKDVSNETSVRVPGTWYSFCCTARSHRSPSTLKGCGQPPGEQNMTGRRHLFQPKMLALLIWLGKFVFDSGLQFCD